MTGTRRWVGFSLALGAAASFSAPALAHTGLQTVGGLVAGLAHPFLGVDHTLAMISVGALAALAAQGGGNRRALWALPLSFMSVMALGGALALAGVALPAVEQGIAASLIVSGALLAARLGLPLPTALVVVGAFALFHGHAHGAELPLMSSELAYVAGFVLATGLLHLAGIGLGLVLPRLKAYAAPALRFAGGAVAACGLVLLIG